MALVKDISFGKGVAPVYPDWAPDSMHLVVEVDYYKLVGGDWQPDHQAIATIATAARSPRPRVITPRRLTPRQPAWSNDGRSIAFDEGNVDPFSGTGPASNIWTVAPDGSQLIQVTHQGQDDDWVALPSWSRRGLLATRITGGSITLAAIDKHGRIRDLIDGGGQPVAGLRPRIQPGF